MPFFSEKSTVKHPLPLTVPTIAIILAILFFGLWPKSWSTHNDVQFLSTEKSLRFHGSGIAYVDQVKPLSIAGPLSEFAIHLSIAPETVRKTGFKPIFMFNDGNDSKQLTVWHWGPSIIVMNGDDYNGAKKWPRIFVQDALSAGEPIFFTITTKSAQTRLFINGKLATETKDLQLTIPENGEDLLLILGNSVYGKHGWAGDLNYFSLFDTAFSKEEVLQYYKNWKAKGEHQNLNNNARIRYTFGTNENQVIPDQSGNNQSLQLPDKLTVFKKAFLTLPLHSFQATKSFWTDTILNLIGFMPLGAVVYCWLHQNYALPRRRKFFCSLAFCFSISLVIETLQGWLPHRSSSMLDLILNTIGALLGIVCIGMLSRPGKTEISH